MTQLYAKLKRSSKYAHQHDGKEPFPVEVVGYDTYIFNGNGNQYRLSDLRLYVVFAGQFVAIN